METPPQTQPPGLRLVEIPSSPEAVECRLADLERQITAIKSKPKDRWDKLQVWGPILSAVLSGLAIAGSAWLFSDRVKAAFQERELRLESVKEMRDLLVKMGDNAIDPATATADARALSAFGVYSIPPLIAQLEAGTNRHLGAKAGLRAVGIMEPVETCKQLEGVVRNRSGLFQMQTHRTAIELLGILHCTDATPTLESYEQVLKSGANDNIYADEQLPSLENMATLRQVLSSALQKLTSKP